MKEWSEAKPKVLPAGWSVVREEDDGMMLVRNIDGLTLIMSAALEEDGRPWIHLSIAHRKRMPTWDDLVTAKELFIGRERAAYQVLAPRSEWVNIHERCLHLFACLDGDVLPDFTHGTGSL